MLRRARCAVVLLLPACFHPVYDRVACGPGGACPSGFRCSAELICESGSSVNAPDASTGNPGDAATDAGCGFADLVNTCLLSFDADLPVTGSAVYDTDTHVLTINGTATPVSVKTVTIDADMVDVISARDVHFGVSASLRAVGSHGLAIIASHDLILDQDALIDVSNGGAGARTSCPGGATQGGNNTNGAGGGGGGGFGGTGGGGGAGNRDGVPVQGGTAGAAELPFPAGFHGGCPGAPGGTGDVLGGSGGRGGGALYLVAGNRIVLSGFAPIDAGGGGGTGGGGGSGGLLILEAPHILASTATIAANGGAGGEGSDAADAGANGDAGTRTTERASGGAGSALNGSDGGAGGSALGSGGGSVTDSAPRGGGGGGGSVGFIRIRSPDAVFFALSPQPS